MIVYIRNPILRRAAVIVTVVSLVIIEVPFYVVRCVREEFGEDIVAAWRGRT